MSEVYLANSLVTGSGDHDVYLHLGGQVPLALVCPVEGHVGAKSLARSQGVQNFGSKLLPLTLLVIWGERLNFMNFLFSSISGRGNVDWAHKLHMRGFTWRYMQWKTLQFNTSLLPT